MNNFKEISNDELAKSIIDLTNGGDVSIAHLHEAARRLSAMPRIYDVATGERPEENIYVDCIAIDAHGGYIMGEYFSERFDRHDTLETVDLNEDVKFMIKIPDIIAWVKGDG
jgi:hypothetical protein